MKLITKTVLIYGISFLIAIILSGALNYYFLERKIQNRIDNRLILEKERVLSKINNEDNISPALLISERVKFSEPNFNLKSDTIFSLEAIDEIDEEINQLRVLQTNIKVGEKEYLLTITRNLEGTTNFAENLLYTFSLSLIILLLILFLSQAVFARKTWEPFYSTLSKLQETNIYKDDINLEPSGVIEFDELNKELNYFIKKVKESYLEQKQFSENLSHELLTPLAIIRSKTELLLQSPNLNEKDLLNIDDIIKTVNRLSKINKSLILLSKIENNQFVDQEKVIINEVVEQSLENFEDQIRIQQLEVRLENSPILEIETNKNLLEILVSNLVKNAVFHNIHQGKIEISIQKNTLVITNTGLVNEKSTDQLFERFVANSKSDHSIGLGLSIVGRICESLGFEINYNNKQDVHQVILHLN